MKEQLKPPMKEQLKAQFPELTDADFDSHESDLYVRAKSGVADWLGKHGQPFTTFKSEDDGSMWLDLPFQNEEFWRTFLR